MLLCKPPPFGRLDDPVIVAARSRKPQTVPGETGPFLHNGCCYLNRLHHVKHARTGGERSVSVSREEVVITKRILCHAKDARRPAQRRFFSMTSFCQVSCVVRMPLTRFVRVRRVQRLLKKDGACPPGAETRSFF